uniref:Zonadhesin n=1 Tax=Syphacia muris TaxID=451379 RepID=A0A0N5ARS8_9BILA
MLLLNSTEESSLRVYWKVVISLIIFIGILENSSAQRSKLCGDTKCTEKLFDAKFIRGFNSSHPSHLSYAPDHIIHVYAIRTNDRPELLEGALYHQPDRRGYFFSPHMDMDAYTKFLKEALETNRTFYRVSAELDDQNNRFPRVLGMVPAVPELLKEYEKVLNATAIAKGQTPQALDLATLGLKKISDDFLHAGHGHSHGPHGHSHDVYVKIHQEHLHIDKPPVVNNQKSGDLNAYADLHPVEDFKNEKKPLETVENQQPLFQTDDSKSNTLSVQNNKNLPDLVDHEAQVGVVPPVLPADNKISSASLTQQTTTANEKIITAEATGNNHIPQSEQTPSLPQQASLSDVSEQVVATVTPIKTQDPSVNSGLNDIVLNHPENMNVQETSASTVIPVMHESIAVEVTPASQPLDNLKTSQNVLESEVKVPSKQDSLDSGYGRDPVVAENVDSSQLTTTISTSTEFSLHQQTVTSITLPSVNDISTSTTVTATGSTASVYSTAYSTIISSTAFSSTTLLSAVSSTPLVTTTIVQSKVFSEHLQEQQQQTGVSGESVSNYQGKADQLHQHTVTYNIPSGAPAASGKDITSTPLPPHQHSTEKLETVSSITTVEPVAHTKQSITTQSPQSYDIVGSDGLGYCVKGNCENSLGEEIPAHSNDDRAKPAQNFFKNFSSMYLLSSGEIDLTKVIFLLLGLMLLSVHLVMMVFGSESKEENIESKTLHDVLSALKVRDQRIKELFCEIEKARNSVVNDSSEEVLRLDKELKLKEDEVKRLQQNEYDLKAVSEENEKLKGALNREKARVKILTEQLDKSESSVKACMLNEQLIEVQSNSDALKDKIDHLERKNAENEVNVENNLKEVSDLKENLKMITEERRNLYKQIDDLKFENAQLSELYETMQKHAKAENASFAAENVNVSDEQGTTAQESGSGGWSDIGDFDIDIADEKKGTPEKVDADEKLVKEQSVESYSSLSTSNIVEIARLRGQLERAKIKLQEEEKNSGDLLRRLNLAETEAEKCRKEVEVKDAERIDVTAQCKKLLTMDTRLKHLDEVIERLLDEKAKMQNEFKELCEEKQHLETKLNEVEQELKRLQTDHDRLRKRHFHELRECKQENTALQQMLKSRQIGALETVLDDSGNLLNSSGNVAESNSLSPPGLLSGLSVPPLWSDGDTDVFSGAESSRAERSSLSRNRQRLFDDAPQHSSGKALKSRHREHREASPESSSRARKDGRRMRSRSHGRSAAYIPSGMPFSFSSGYDLTARREYLSGGNLYYSSGGSNGGLSPPPLALLSGVPPVDVAIRRPMASTRPKSVVEHGSKNQS